MTDYAYHQVLVWDVNPGGVMRLLRNGAVTVKSWPAGAVVASLTSDAQGQLDFTLTDIGAVTLTSPSGVQSPPIVAAELLATAASFVMSNDAGVAGFVGNPASATTLALAATYETLTHAASTYAGAAFFKRRSGVGSAYTDGDVIILGSYAYNTRDTATGDVGTGIVAGGGPPVYENVVGGNLANVNTATSNLTGAATLTNENGNWDFILSGYDNVVNGWACVVNGFHQKVGLDANHITIAGGSIHTVNASTIYGSIGGGTQHTLGGNNPTIAGGNGNTATGNGSAVGGGQTNSATGTGATVAGGVSNTASNSNATVVGGSTNTASSNSSTVIGGLTNTASTGTGATVAGGRDNLATGAYSLATGRQAVASESGMHAHAQAAFATAGDAQINRWALKKQTTDATASNLEADTGAPPVIPVDTTWAFSALIVARRTDVDGDNAAYKVEGCFKRDAGSTAALVGTPTVTALGASAGASTWTVTVNSFSAGTLRLIVTGEAAKTIRWVCELRASQASG